MGTQAPSPSKGDQPTKPAIAVARVRLRHFGPVELFQCDPTGLTLGATCIVGFDRGHDFGTVLALALDSPSEAPEQRIERACQAGDLMRIEQNAKDARNHIAVCTREIEAHHLPMKVVDAEFTFDRGKIVFYFAADDRVDFRDLVRDLARQMKMRIELRQVGIRDETRMLGGVACCGRVTCCSSWIQEFTPVNIRMAKLQQLQLHPVKLSGLCNRLKCCLAYEAEAYRELEALVPARGQRVRTPEGTADVMDSILLTQEVTVRFDDGVIKSFAAKDVTVVSRTKAHAKARAKRRKANQEGAAKEIPAPGGDDDHSDDDDRGDM